jgi:hypothetical protein
MSSSTPRFGYKSHPQAEYIIILGNIRVYYNAMNVMDEIASCIKLEVVQDVMCNKMGFEVIIIYIIFILSPCILETRCYDIRLVH